MARVVLHNKGFRELRTCEPVRRYVQDQAEDVASRAGEPTEALITENPRNRARSAVIGPRFKSEDMLRAIGMTTYTTKAGKTRLASQAQIDNWTRGSRIGR